jgi:ubiquinone/menaquinone biosynthesis C-methylase UbiE
MLRQRSDSACPAVVGCAESLPFSDGSFDAAMGTFTLHHWTDLPQDFVKCSESAADK